MSFWQKFKEGFRRFMAGRYGADALSQGIIIAGLVLFLLAVFTRIGLFSLLAMALYIWANFSHVFAQWRKARAGKCALLGCYTQAAHQRESGAYPVEKSQKIPLFPLPQLPCPPALASRRG